MAFLEITPEISLKVLLEMIIALASVIMVYFSYKVKIHLESIKNKLSPCFNTLFIGFTLGSLSVIFELIDSFYLDIIFDNLQLIAGFAAYLILLIGFKKGFEISGGNNNVRN